MEKLIYPLWMEPGRPLNERWVEDLSRQLLESPVRGLRIAIVDEAVAAAAGMVQAKLTEAPSALVSLWLDSAWKRDTVEAVIASACDRYAGYAVSESAPLGIEETEGQRVAGMNQVVFLECPGHLTRAQWLQTWLEEHTPIAIDTQSTFAYRQNVVVRALTADAPSIDAIVEEAFPDAAMTSPLAFYDVDSEEELQARLTTMIESCARFIDFERLNVTPMSDYLLKRPQA